MDYPALEALQERKKKPHRTKKTSRRGARRTRSEESLRAPPHKLRVHVRLVDLRVKSLEDLPERPLLCSTSTLRERVGDFGAGDHRLQDAVDVGLGEERGEEGGEDRGFLVLFLGEVRAGGFLELGRRVGLGSGDGDKRGNGVGDEGLDEA